MQLHSTCEDTLTDNRRFEVEETPVANSYEAAVLHFRIFKSNVLDLA